MGSGSETEAKEEEENNKEWDRDGETPRRAQVEAVNVGGEVTPRGKTLTYLTSSFASVSDPLPMASWRSCCWSRLMFRRGAAALSPYFPPPYSSSTFAPSCATPAPSPLGVPGLLSAGCRGLATRWSSPQR